MHYMQRELSIMRLMEQSLCGNILLIAKIKIFKNLLKHIDRSMENVLYWKYT